MATTIKGENITWEDRWNNCFNSIMEYEKAKQRGKKRNQSQLNYGRELDRLKCELYKAIEDYKANTPPQLLQEPKSKKW